MAFGISAGTAALIGGGLAAAGSIGGAMISANGAQSAAADQAAAAGNATAMQNAQWQQTQANLKPYLDLGSSAINPLRAAMGYDENWSADPNNILNQKFAAPTADQAAGTPGYQFTLDQGLKAAQNSAAARGLGTSGAAMKGAASYATGLADSTYNDVFNRALQTFNTNYGTAANKVNRLSSVVGNGQNAAATNGSLGATTMGNIGDTLTSGANASAAGRIGSANALSGAMSGIGNNAMMYGMMQNNAGGGAGYTNAGISGSLTGLGSGNAFAGYGGGGTPMNGAYGLYGN